MKNNFKECETKFNRFWSHYEGELKQPLAEGFEHAWWEENEQTADELHECIESCYETMKSVEKLQSLLTEEYRNLHIYRDVVLDSLPNGGNIGKKQQNRKRMKMLKDKQKQQNK